MLKYQRLDYQDELKSSNLLIFLILCYIELYAYIFEKCIWGSEKKVSRLIIRKVKIVKEVLNKEL